MNRQSLFDWCLKIFLFLSPVFFFRDYQLSFARGMFFVFGSFALFIVSLAKEPQRKFNNPWLALILACAFLRMFFDSNFGSPQNEWFNFWLSAAGFIYVLAGGILFYTIYCHAGEPKSYLKPILAVCGLNFALVMAQLAGLDFMWERTPSICGFMETNSQLGQYSAMATILIGPWFAIIPVFMLFVSRSISSILALFVGAMFLSWQLKKRWLICALIVAAIGLAAYNHQYIAQKWRCRPIMWQKTLKVALQKPYLGWGYRSFNKEVLELKELGTVGINSREFSRPHNDYLHTMQELGIPLIIFIVGFFISIGRKFLIKKDKDRLTYLLAASILIALINGCGQTLARYASVMGTWIILLAFLFIKLEDNNAI